MPVPTGTTIGAYEIVAPLGHGAMGDVYRARDTRLGRDVAIKILPAQFTTDAERRARFAHEARVLATLKHPHIGSIYGLEESNGLTALVLELVEGPTLAERLTSGPLPMADALTVAKQIAEALEEAHEKGIVHRDLKPANIVLEGAGETGGGSLRAKVLDFGLAKSLAAHGSNDVTREQLPSPPHTVHGVVVGTPAYMSPEQARGLAVDKRTDVWAFGCVVFEMFAGRRPFEGATITDTLAQILDREPDWSLLPHETPAPVARLLQRCLRKDRRKRLHDIGDAILEIDDAAVPGSANRTAAAPPAPVGRRIALPWLLAVALGGVLLASSVSYFRSRQGAPTDVVEFAMTAPEHSRLAGGFAISPDGRQVAFTASYGGTAMIWVRPLATSEPRMLPGTEGARHPFWSPDGNSLGFFANRQLKTIPLNGGAPVVLCAAYDPTGYPPSGTWSGEDVIVFTVGHGPLQQIGAANGSGGPRTATQLSDSETAHLWPQFLPDNQHFLYFAQRGEIGEVRVGSLSSTETASLGRFESQAAYADGSLFFVRGGNLVAQPFDVGRLRLQGKATVLGRTAVDPPWQRGAFSVSPGGRLVYRRASRTPSDLTWRDRHGTAQGTVGEPGVYFNVDLSGNSRRLAASRLVQPPGEPAQFDIWIFDLDRGNAATRLAGEPGWEFDPAWSPDGRVVFTSNRPNPEKSPLRLFVRPSDGSGKDEPLPTQDGDAYSPDWSRDGRFIVYSYTKRGSSTGLDLWTLEMTANAQPTEFLTTNYDESNPSFSPDGRWIAYHSNASGRNEVYVRPFPGGRSAHLISRDGGWHPRWRGDGKELYFQSPDGTMMAVSIDSANGMTAGIPEKLFLTAVRPAAGNNRPYAVSNDGERFLLPELQADPPLIVVLNWPALLAR